MIKLKLKGLRVLVTGASQGIGMAIAEFLCDNDAQVAVHYNTGDEAAKALCLKYSHTHSQPFQADLSDTQAVTAMFDAVVRDFGQIDVTVLNAGVFIPHSTEETTTEWFETWRRTMSINLDAVGLLTKLGIDHYKEIGLGRFIYIGSRAVFRGETEEYLAYAASKGGLTSLARSVARSFGKNNIMSFVVAPGFTRTAMAEQFIEDHGEDRVLDEIVLNKLTLPQDIAPMVGMLCSGLMDHATGATIDMNAGSHIR